MYDTLSFSEQKFSIIHSNANLEVHGQGLLNLSGPGDRIEAQRLVLALFYSIHVSFCLCLYVLTKSWCLATYNSGMDIGILAVYIFLLFPVRLFGCMINIILSLYY